jgi:hypothetical protein
MEEAGTTNFCVSVYITYFSFSFSGLCEVETGQSNIILDIEESRETRKFKFKYRSVV